LESRGRLMFDELSGTEDSPEEMQKTLAADAAKPARDLYRWSHVIGLLAFCLLYFPFQHYRWSLLVAFAVSYSVFTFAIALGLALDDSSDFFGDSRAVKCVAALQLPHALILTLITVGGYLWLHFKPILPLWVTTDSRLSFWDYLGIFVLWFVGTREGIWMAGKIKSRLRQSEDRQFSQSSD
jgi:hypothetical protein